MIPATAKPKHRAPGHVHIDRLKVAGPLEHAMLGEAFFKGHPDYGHYAIASEAMGTSKKHQNDPNEFYVRSTRISDNGLANEIVLDCCPPMQLQGHNLFGHADVLDYTNAIFDRTTSLNSLPVGESQLREWRTGQTKLLGMHITGNLGSPSHAKGAILNAVDQNNPKGKRRDPETCLTLGLVGKGRSEYHTLTLYDKYCLLSIDWPKPGPLQRRILALANETLRVEIKLHAQWLRTYGIDEDGKIVNLLQLRKTNPAAALKVKSLAYTMNWATVDIDALFFELLNTYQIRNAIQRVLTNDEEAMLTKAERRAYLLWLKGEILADNYERTSCWQLSKSVHLKTGVDMRAVRRPERLPQLDLLELFTANNLMPVPSWAHGTSCYVAPGSFSPAK